MNSIKEIILERNAEAEFLEEIFNKALIGSAIPIGQKHVAIYDSEKCIKIIMEELDMGEMEAFAQFQVTTKLSDPGINQPIFFNDFRDIKEIPPNILNDIIDNILG